MRELVDLCALRSGIMLITREQVTGSKRNQTCTSATMFRSDYIGWIDLQRCMEKVCDGIDL